MGKRIRPSNLFLQSLWSLVFKKVLLKVLPKILKIKMMERIERIKRNKKSRIHQKPRLLKKNMTVLEAMAQTHLIPTLVMKIKSI